MIIRIMFTATFMIGLWLLDGPNTLHAQSSHANDNESPFFATTPCVRPSPGNRSDTGNCRFSLKWLPDTEQYVQAKRRTDRKTGGEFIEISLHDRAGRILRACLINKNIDDHTEILDFAVMPSGSSLTIGLHRCDSPTGENILQSYALPELTLRWEKQFPDDELFQIISPHGILTSNNGEKAVYDPNTGAKLCDISRESVKRYFDPAIEDGLVKFASNKFLVYIEGAADLRGAAGETPNDITIYRFDLRQAKSTATALKLESPKRKRRYDGYAVTYDPSTDALYMGSRTGVVDVFDASTGKLTSTVKVQTPDEKCNLPILFPGTLSKRPLIMCVGEDRRILCFVNEKDQAIPIIRSKYKEISVHGIHPTLPLAFFTSSFLLSNSIGILNYDSSSVDGAILVHQRDVGAAQPFTHLSANDSTFWTNVELYGEDGRVREVTEWSLSSGEKIRSFQVTSNTQRGGFAGQSGRCFLISDKEGVEVHSKTGVMKHPSPDRLHGACADETCFYFARRPNSRPFGRFDLMTTGPAGPAFVRTFSGYLPTNDNNSLASDHGRFAIANCARVDLSGYEVENAQYLLIFNRNSNSQHQFKQDKEVNNMVWIGDRLILAQGERVVWYDQPLKANTQVTQDDGQISGKVESVHRMGEDLVVVSKQEDQLVISLCGWDEDGLVVKQERRIRGESPTELVAVAAGCFFYAHDNYVVATRIGD